MSLAVGLAAGLAMAEMREEHRPILDLGTFADAGSESLPDGWCVVAGDSVSDREDALSPERWALTDLNVPGLGAALCITAGGQTSLVSAPIPLEEGLQALSAAIMATGGGEARVDIVWMRGSEIVETTSLRGAPPSPDGRRRFNISGAVPPEGVETARLLLVCDPEEGASFCWQTVSLTAEIRYEPEVRLLGNRVGYELLAPKRFTVQANFLASDAKFTVFDEVGAPVYTATLSHGERVRGACGANWDGYYYQGDFTDLDEEGAYMLTVELDACAPVTALVEIRFNLLWEEAFLPAVAPFRGHRAEAAAEALTLWDDPGLNAASDAELLWELTRAWSFLRYRFPNDPPLAALEEEVLYGADRLAAYIMDGHADQIMDLNEGYLFLNALGCVARHRPDTPRVLEAARRVIAPLLDERRGGVWLFCAAMDLYVATDEEPFLDYARDIFPGIALERVEPLLDYEDMASVSVTIELMQTFDQIAQQLLRAAENPFGLVRTGPGFFTRKSTDEHPLLGGNVRILDTVDIVAQAYRYTANQDFHGFVHDQINWLLGNNPFGKCLVKGLCGDADPPVAGASLPVDAAGVVLHGIGPQEPHLDLPHLSLAPDGVPNETTNGYALRNNARYIGALAYLKRIPTTRPRQ